MQKYISIDFGREGIAIFPQPKGMEERAKDPNAVFDNLFEFGHPRRDASKATAADDPNAVLSTVIPPLNVLRPTAEA